MYRRIPSLDVESNQSFLGDVRAFAQAGEGNMSEVARRRMLEILKENGLAPDAVLPMQKVIALAENDPNLMASARLWLTVQQLTWKGVKDLFHADPDRYLSELQQAEKAGPGSLELNPTIEIPDYARHEIHIMPGGFVGDTLAGYIYHYGTDSFYLGHNYKDENQLVTAQAAPAPKDGRVRRILDVGCSIGQITTALKRRFPDAEVWGLDISSPMVRYAHMRTADIGMNVNYIQGNAEKMTFPDGHFDLVVSHLLLHEVPNAVNTKLMKEISRVLRRGGTYFPTDYYTATPKPKLAYHKFRRWWDHRWNGEPWALEHIDYDLAGDLRKAGMDVIEAGPQAGVYNSSGSPNLMATKI